MFTPVVKRGKYDRNIFNGNETFTRISAENSEILAYFMGDVIVGTISGIVDAILYRSYKRGKFLPIQIYHNGVDYCGWIDENKIEVVA